MSLLGSVATIVMGQSPAGETCGPLETGLPLLNGPTEFGPHHPAPVQFTTEGRKLALPGDILFCVRGSTTGRMNWADREYAVGRGVAAIRHKRDPKLQPLVRAVIEAELPSLLAQATGSTFPNVSADQLAAIPWPSLTDAEQRDISHILGTLDDKIELNRRLSETLEALVRALFKSWFVDFDPVRAKAEGRDPGLPKPLADLFPARLVESELGEIPEGWEVRGLDEIATFLNGLALQKFPAVPGEESLPVIKIAELRSGVTAKSDRANKAMPREYIVGDGDVLFSWSGSLELTIWCGGPGALNQHLFKVTSPRHPVWLAHGWIDRHLPEFRAIAADKATTMGHIQRRHLSEARTVIPPAPVLARADAIMRSLWNRRVLNSLQTRTLSVLRDALLPKLVTGVLRVREVERVVELAM